jgi:hypothetical protein
MEKKAQAHGALAVMARFLHCLQTEPPSIVEYVEQAKFVGKNNKLRKWPDKKNRNSELVTSHFVKIGLAATLVAGIVATSNDVKAVRCNINQQTCNSGALASYAAVFSAGMSANMVHGSSVSLVTLLSLARRRKRGNQEAKRNFDGILTDGDVLNGVTLFPAMQRFYAAKSFFKNSGDFAALAFVETGDNIVDCIVSSPFRMDQSGILQAAKDSLHYYNNQPTDEDKTNGFTALEAKFADPKFIGALAPGIFNGDDHQELVDALTQYGDKDELHTAMISLCTNASVFIDVATKLQEIIPDLLDPKIVSKARDLEQYRFSLIKAYPDIAEGFGLDLRPDADIDAVNAAFADLDLSGVVHLPSQANDGNREAQLEAKFAALEAGSAAARAALNPGEQATMARLEQEARREGRGGGR